MPRRKTDPEAVLASLADLVLENGLNSASLRPMAAAANTSDRMLICPFGSKEGLIAELFRFLAERMAAGLDAALPPQRYKTETELVRAIVSLRTSDAFQPYTRVWLDIVPAASQGHKPHRETGHTILNLYLDWFAERHPDGKQGAIRALMLLEGALILDALGHGATVRDVLS